MRLIGPWRCSWPGVALQPYLLLESYPDNVTLIFNQFGDTNVAYYSIYGEPISQSTNFLANSTSTLARLTYLQNGVTYYFRVIAVHRDGTLGQFSNEQSVTVNLIQPGQNMVANGTFSSSTLGVQARVASDTSGGNIQSAPGRDQRPAHRHPHGAKHRRVANLGDGERSVDDECHRHPEPGAAVYGRGWIFV